MSNVIDLFGEEELDMPSASEVFEALAEELEGEDKGVHCVAICYKDGVLPLIAGNTHPFIVNLLLTLAQVTLENAKRTDEEEPDVVH
jgi:hypothetical protein